MWCLRWRLVCLLGGYCSLFCGWFGCVFVGLVVVVVMRCQRTWFGFCSCSLVMGDCAGRRFGVLIVLYGGFVFVVAWIDSL